MRRFEQWMVGLVVFGLGAAACFGDVNDQSDTDAPFVDITAPKADTTVDGLVTIQANVQDAFGVDKVVFKIDGNTVFEDVLAPYQTNWNTVGAGDGPHVIRVEATDINGNNAGQSINVTVDNRKS